MIIQEVKKSSEEKMEKAIQVLKKDLLTLRTGRANPAILDKVQVEYYGSLMQINQLANLSIPDSRTMLIAPWDKSALPEIERGILKAELGLTPTNDGNVIRISVPALTEERRNELVKMARKLGEEGKVSVRNIRRDANEELKKQEKSREITEDDCRRGQDEIQRLTDKVVKEIDGIISSKEKEIIEI